MGWRALACVADTPRNRGSFSPPASPSKPEYGAMLPRCDNLSTNETMRRSRSRTSRFLGRTETAFAASKGVIPITRAIGLVGCLSFS
jgi:hypothetical protein